MNKTELKEVKEGKEDVKFGDSILENVNKDTQSQAIRKESDQDGQSSSAHFSQAAVIDGKNPILKFDPVRATNKVKGFRQVELIKKSPQQNLDAVKFEKINFGFEEFG